MSLPLSHTIVGQIHNPTTTHGRIDYSRLPGLVDTIQGIAMRLVPHIPDVQLREHSWALLADRISRNQRQTTLFTLRADDVVHFIEHASFWHTTRGRSLRHDSGENPTATLATRRALAALVSIPMPSSSPDMSVGQPDSARASPEMRLRDPVRIQDSVSVLDRIERFLLPEEPRLPDGFEHATDDIKEGD